MSRYWFEDSPPSLLEDALWCILDYLVAIVATAWELAAASWDYVAELAGAGRQR